MRLGTAEHLLDAVRASGLLSPEQLDTLASDQMAGGSAEAVLRRLIQREIVTHYQLRKVNHGKVAELFVGPYVVTDKLGEGGMGKVYRARSRAGGPTIALKVVRSVLLSNPTIRGRYQREVQATAALDHPNIVRVFDAGEADGKFFLAMEFVDGIDLARLMRDYRMLEVPEACEYVRQAALGLQHAHDKGFVHRDVKPSNIVVAGERHLPGAGEPAVVKLLDLGLSRAIDPEDMVAPDLTRDHTVVGTPDYMAPEQARHSRHPDPRSDLYSLGCALFFLLIGKPPFPHASAVEKLLAHQKELPPSVRSLRPGVSVEVAAVLERLLAKRPEDRFQSAVELARALEPYTTYAPGAVRTPPPPPQAEIETPHLPGPAADRPTPRSSVGSFGSLGSLASLSPLPLSEVPTVSGVSRPGSTVVAPPPVGASDRTPEPPPAPRPQRTRPRKVKTRPPPRRWANSPLLWGVVALLGAAVIALCLWLVSQAL